jgi:nitrogen PTS system EIIA component
MKIETLITPDGVLVDPEVRDKRSLLAACAKHASVKLGLKAADILAALNHREALGSTGMGGGIAIPHARLELVQLPIGVFARLKTPIAFDAIDDQLVDLIFVLLLPSSAPGQHLNALAAVARQLRDPEVRARLRSGKSQAVLYEALINFSPSLS